MMKMDRKQQCLLLDGVCYTPEDVARIVDRGAEGMAPGHRDLFVFLQRWLDDSPFLTVHTSGSTGVPKELVVRKEQMMQSARLTCEFLGLKEGDPALLCMNLRYIGAMMVVVRALVAGLNLLVRPASGHPLADVREPLRFAAMVPLQVYHSLQVDEERRQLYQTDNLIIGGGAVDEALERELKGLPTAVYSTYGMTETLSHIALRRLSGPQASERYTPFPSVDLSLATDDTLIIRAPLVCDEPLYTHDMARLYPDGTFTILGRMDNVINSGGVKIQAEEVERILRPLLACPFVVTSVPDVRLGQAVTLLVEGKEDVSVLEEVLRRTLPPYHRPRHILFTEQIPHTGNGKIGRAACRELAERIYSGKSTL